MIERIAELVNEAQDAIAAASSTAELEQLRVRYVGRKAELPNMLRGIGSLPPAGARADGQGRERRPPVDRGADRRACEGAVRRRARAAPRR